MIEESASSTGTSGLVERLSSLNGILGGVRESLETYQRELHELKAKDTQLEQKVEGFASDLETMAQEPSSNLLDGRFEDIHQLLNGLRAHLQERDGQDDMHIDLFRRDLEGLRHQVGNDLDQMRGQWSALEQQTIEWQQQSSQLDPSSLDELWSSLTELRELHLESNHFQSSKIEEHSGHLHELNERHSTFQVRLQQLESFREQLRIELDALRSVGEGDRQAWHGIREDWEQKWSRLENDAQLLSSQIENEKNSLHHRIDEVFGRITGIEEDLGRYAQNSTLQHDELSKFNERVEGLKAKDRDFEESIHNLRSQLEFTSNELEMTRHRIQQGSDATQAIQEMTDGLAQREVAGRAKFSELSRSVEEVNRSVLALQCEMGERLDQDEQLQAELHATRDHWKAELTSLKEQCSALGEQFENLQQGQIRLGEEIHRDSEKKIATVSHELTLAQDNLEDLHKQVHLDIDDLKKGQKELGGLSVDMEDRVREHRESRQEIHRLKDYIEELRYDMRRQKTASFVGIAAAFVVAGAALLVPFGEPAPQWSELPQTAQVLEAPTPSTWVMPTEEENPSQVVAEKDDLAQLGYEEALTSTPEAPTLGTEEPVEESIIKPAFSAAPSEMVSDEQADAPQDNSVVQYVVQEGDNLWEIAKKHPSSEPLMKRVEKIQKDNQLETATIRRGQVLRIFL